MGIHCIAAISCRLRHRLVQKVSDRGARSDESDGYEVPVKHGLSVDSHPGSGGRLVGDAAEYQEIAGCGGETSCFSDSAISLQKT